MITNIATAGNSANARKHCDSSHNSIIFQLDLGLKTGGSKVPQVLMGWAIEPDDRDYSPHPYRIHNLAYKYRIAPPFSGDEAIRAIAILGDASKHRDPVAANNRVESAWSAIVCGGAN